MEPEAQVLRDRCKRALGDPVAMALLSFRLERHGCLLLLLLYADVEVRCLLRCARCLTQCH